MKIYNNAMVLVPYYNEGRKDWLKISVRDPICRRALLKNVRKFIKQTFNKQVGNDWVKQHCIITEAQKETASNVDKFINEWIERIENAPDEQESDSPSETEDTGVAGTTLRPVWDSAIRG